MKKNRDIAHRRKNTGTRYFLIAILAVSALVSPAALRSVNAQQDAAQPDESLAKDASTEINVKNADIAAIVRIFSKKTKRNYILF